jgi:hypothetical protein
MRRPGKPIATALLVSVCAAVPLAACVGSIGDGAPETTTGSNETPDPGRQPTGDAGSQATAQSLDCTTVKIGNVPMRRLTREEYANAVRDLLGVAAPASDSLPSDEAIGPFASNTVVPVTDSVIESYMATSEALVAQVAPQLGQRAGCPAATIDAACATQFISAFGRLAYRRPLTGDETTRYQGLLAPYAAKGDFTNGVRVVAQTMLESPYFLYRVELAIPDPSLGATAPLGPYEVASRLAFLFWNSTPDNALLDAAAQGILTTPDGVKAQAQRLLADDRAKDALTSFHFQWLELGDLAALSKDPAFYPSFSSDMPQAMANETKNFIDYAIRQDDGSLRTLLTASYSFPEGPLFSLYGVGSISTSGSPVPMNPLQRAGIFTQASFLADHAHPNQPSPVQRGKVIRRDVLCDVLPDPPPNVNTQPPDPSPDASTRQRFAVHESNPSCGACHTLMDPIGFAFENYDGLGAFMTTESSQPVDATGEIKNVRPGGADIQVNGAVDLAQKLSQSAQVQQCVVTQWYRFAFGHLEGTDDACALQGLGQSFTASDLNIRDLLVAIATSDSFRLRKVTP